MNILKQLRGKRSLREIADFACMSHESVRKIESGKYEYNTALLKRYIKELKKNLNTKQKEMLKSFILDNFYE